MSSKKNIFGITAVVVLIAVVALFSQVIEGYETKYEVRPEIRFPECRTDAARTIGAYERLMERYMTLSEKKSAGIKADLKGLWQKLNSIDRRLARIENNLGIESPEAFVPGKRKGSQKGKVAPKDMSPKSQRAEGGGNYSL